MSLKIVIAAVTAATFSLAFAQSTPPAPASDPAVGAGQRNVLAGQSVQQRGEHVGMRGGRNVTVPDGLTVSSSA